MKGAYYIHSTRLVTLEINGKRPQVTCIKHQSWLTKPFESPKLQQSIMDKKLSDRMTYTPIYKVIFFNQGQIFEIYAKQIYQSDLYGFIELEELVFGEKSQMLVDPSEEKLKSEFDGVNRSYIPMHAVVRIDEVDKEGTSKISEAKGGNVAPFPMSAFTPKGGGKE